MSLGSTKTKQFISSAHSIVSVSSSHRTVMAEGGRRSIQLLSHALQPFLDMWKSLCLCAAFSCVFCELNAAYALWDWSIGNAAID